MKHDGGRLVQPAGDGELRSELRQREHLERAWGGSGIRDAEAMQSSLPRAPCSFSGGSSARGREESAAVGAAIAERTGVGTLVADFEALHVPARSRYVANLTQLRVSQLRPRDRHARTRRLKPTPLFQLLPPPMRDREGVSDRRVALQQAQSRRRGPHRFALMLGPDPLCGPGRRRHAATRSARDHLFSPDRAAGAVSSGELGDAGKCAAARTSASRGRHQVRPRARPDQLLADELSAGDVRILDGIGDPNQSGSIPPTNPRRARRLRCSWTPVRGTVTTHLEVADRLSDPPPELWERVAGIPSVWLGAHPAVASRLVRVRAIGLWLSLVWVLVLLVLVPEVRASVRAYAASFLLVVVWFVLVRSKSISWATTARVFTACVAWSAVIGWFTLRIAGGLDLWPSSDGASTALAGFLEESGKLVPLLALVLVAPGRVRRFAAADWAMLGFVSGAAFNAYEDALRQIGSVHGIFMLSAEKTYSVNPWASGRFVTIDGVAVSPGHHLWTATAAMSIGLGIALWRSDRWGRRVAAFALPVATVLLVIAEHASFNAHNISLSWPQDGGEGFSPVLSSVWSLSGHGRASGVLAVVLLAACLAVDAHRRHHAALLAPADADRLRPGGAVFAMEPGARALARWRARIGRLVGRPGSAWDRLGLIGLRVLAASGSLVIEAVSQWWADLVLVVVAHARVDGEPRRDAIRRGRAVAVRVRGIRAEAMTLATPGHEPHARRRFAVVGGVIGGLALLACVSWGSHMAAAIGASLRVEGDSTYLAGLLDNAGAWWGGLSPWQQIAVGAGIAALIALSGGSLGLALGVSGIATYGLTKAHGAATFTRNPAAATTNYLSTTTPLEALLDTGEFALTFVPGNFAGAAAGRGARALAGEAAWNPAAFTVARRTAMSGDAGVVTPEFFLGRRTIELADGAPMPALSSADASAALSKYNASPASHLHAQGPEAAFQRGIYGDNERVIALSEGRVVIPDGFTSQYGAIGDAKFVASERSFYIPESMGNAALGRVAQERMDRTLARLSSGANALGGNRVVELTTNNVQAAQFIEARMRALGVHGYVRIIEGAP